MNTTHAAQRIFRPCSRLLAIWLLLGVAAWRAEALPPFITGLGPVSVGMSLEKDLAFTIGDPDTAITNLVVDASSSDNGLINISAADISGLNTSPSRTINLDPQPNQLGTATISVWVSDGTQSTTNTFLLTVTPNLTIDFSSPATNAPTDMLFSGNITYSPAGATITRAVTSGSSIVPLANVVVSGTGTGQKVDATRLPRTGGMVDIQLTATDSGSGTSTSTTFQVYFEPNQPPVITVASPADMLEDQAGFSHPFTVSDPDSSLNPMDAYSSDTSLIIVSDTDISGTGSSRSIALDTLQDQNGTATLYLIASDEETTITNSFVLNVAHQPDTPVITPGPVPLAYDTGPTNLLPGVTIADVDYDNPLFEDLTATVRMLDPFTTLEGGSPFVTIGSPTDVTAALRALRYVPVANRTPPGTTNTVLYSLVVADGTFAPSNSYTANVFSVNDPPIVTGGLTPPTVAEGQTTQPFHIDSIRDDDVGDDLFSLLVELVDPGQAHLGSFDSTPSISDVNSAGIRTFIAELAYTATAGEVTGLSEDVQFRYTVTDGAGGEAQLIHTLTILAQQTQPSIFGVPFQTVNMTDSPVSHVPYPTVSVADPDAGGDQFVQASLVSSDPALGTLSQSSFALMHPLDLTTALRAVTYTPTSGTRPVNSTANTTFKLVVTDATGLATTNQNVTFSIKAVNNPPLILNVPEADQQPVLLPPVAPILPFAGLGLSSDDTNDVVVTVMIDDPAKGSFTNLGVFVETGPGSYEASGTTNTVLASLVALTYELNDSYLFPVNDPGGTVFTLSASDFALLTSTRTLAIQVQNEPRNHLVTRAQSDALPGSFRYALNNVGNNDVITFALPGYPAVVRMPGTAPTIITRNLTIKGPGADLLTISGDGNGDGVADRQLFRIMSHVAIEGVTLADGTAAMGGALKVYPGASLSLRECAVVNSFATYYGGGIDVEGGSLELYGCFVGRNRLSAEDGLSGAGVALYTDKSCVFVNTTFAQNVQANENGDGGGALVAENATSATILNTYLTHCTFAENEDAADVASAVFSISFGSHIKPLYCIFRDLSGRNLEVSSAGEVISLGGNLCDDSSRTAYVQQGQTEGVSLLNHLTDLVETDALLSSLVSQGDPTPYYPLRAGSLAANKASGSIQSLDQRGVMRGAPADSGAIELAANRRIVINEINADDASLDFIELYVRRDSTPVNLSAYALFVDGVKVHDFVDSEIIGTNAFFSAGDAAGTIIEPGFGMVLAFSQTPISITSDSNPTPVIRPSVTNLNLKARGTLSIGFGGSHSPIASSSYLATFLDPANGTNLLDMAENSISLAPQFLGHALVPHRMILPGPLSGVDPSVAPPVNPSSPGQDAGGTPFGQDNAEPLALANYFTVTEDDVTALDVLANDLDSDGNDRVVVVDVSALSAPGVGDAPTALSQLGAGVAIDPGTLPLRGAQVIYDTRTNNVFQSLPVGSEILDSFYYEIIDIGSAPVEAYADTGSNTLVTVTHHRLEPGDDVVLSGVSRTDYNDTFAVTVIDDDTFTIPVPFATQPTELGLFETASPRMPTSRNETSVTVKVIGVNDAPEAYRDLVTNVTEIARVRIMTRPELAGTLLSVPGDPVPPPEMLSSSLLGNDDDMDTDDAWSNLRVVGVMGQVNTINGYSGTPGQSPVTVQAPGHGLSSADQILIANYGGHPSYDGYHTVTVLDADSFTLPRFFVDDHAEKGVWVILNESSRYATVTDVGAAVTLTLRDSPTEDHIIYDAATSAYLKGLAEDELYTNRFYYAVEDTHGAIGIGPIDLVVVGLNDTPTALPDPTGVSILDPLLGPSNTLETVLAEGLDLMYALPPASGTTGVVDLYVLDLSGTLPGSLRMPDLWHTDEDTPITIDTLDLLANDDDIDRIDTLNVLSVEPLSRAGAALSLSAGIITFDPSAASTLQALARAELLIDTFEIVVSDGMTAGSVTSLVAVLVEGLNDSPIAMPDTIDLSEDDVYLFNPIVHPSTNPALHDIEVDIDGVQPDDRLLMLVVSNLVTGGDARVDIAPLAAQYDATVSEMLNQLADWQDYTDSFDYTITDNSFLFAVDDEFYIPYGTANRVLDVLANDRDYTPAAPPLTIVDAGPTLNGGLLTIASNGQHLVYSAPAGSIGDDLFRYIIENSVGQRQSARVRVRTVIPPMNGILNAADDHYTVAYGETAVLDVIDNDYILPVGGSGLTLTTNLVATSIPGQPQRVGNTFVYTATNGLAPLTFTYEVTAGGPSVAQADVVVEIVDRRGTLPVQNDSYSVLAGSFDNPLDVLANDNLLTGNIDHLRIAAIPDPALFGTLAPNAADTALVYTPDPDFIGIEVVRYLATDGVGGTGTGIVSIAVGKVDTATDFFTVLASTNGLPVTLDVLANDRVLPFAADALQLISATPVLSPIGNLVVDGIGATLKFTPSNVVGQAGFDYIVADGTARVATGRVTIATVSAGIYANTDRFLVRGGGANYALDVLANDVSYPEADRSYSLLSIGTGADAPDAGGSVSIVDNILLYTPAAGFFGQESFTYLMSDATSTDSARVTVTVRRGDLVANADHYAVFYELDSGGTNAMAFTLPVTLNDRIQPALDQVLYISGMGIGSNAPSHMGEVSIGSDGLSLEYRPVSVPTVPYVERFTYEIADGTGRRASAAVWVNVSNLQSNLVALTQDDAYTVERNSLNNLLSPLANDFALPGTALDWSIVSITPTLQGGTVSIAGSQVRYSPPANFVGRDEFAYSVNDGLGGTGSATVRLLVGNLPTQPDWFAVLSGTQSNALDVLANDVLFTSYAEEYTLAGAFGTDQGGSVTVGSSNTVRYTPDAGYAGAYPYTESFLYTVSDDVAGLATGITSVTVYETGSDRSTTTVTVNVAGRNDAPWIENLSSNAPITDIETAQPFVGVTLVEIDEQLQEVIDVLVTLDDAAKGVITNLGAFTDLGNGVYGLTNVTAAAATSNLQAFVFVPTENRIVVPGPETTLFTLTITDTKSAPIVDSLTTIDVIPVNDPPTIVGTTAEQPHYLFIPIEPFSTVLIEEVDDLTLQPLSVTVTLSANTNGTFARVGSFSLVSTGVYRATGLTAAQATAQLRALEFSADPNLVPEGSTLVTDFELSVDDGFAPAVVDSVTSVWSLHTPAAEVVPPASPFADAFGQAVDTIANFAVVGAPDANGSGTESGSAFIYRRDDVQGNTWSEWRILQPATIEAGERFGSAVAISDRHAAVGATGDGASGTVYVYDRDRGNVENWGELLRIIPTGLTADAEFGFSVALDGDLLAVGAPNADLGGRGETAGAVFLYGRDVGGANAWGEIMRWAPTEAGSDFARTGVDVALCDGQLIVGADQYNADGTETGREGAAFVLVPDAGNVWTRTQTLVSSQPSLSRAFGRSVDIDGRVLAIGAPDMSYGGVPDVGRVYVYERVANTNRFNFIRQLECSSDPERRFGTSVSVSGDLVLVGAPENDAALNVGAAYLFRRADASSSEWAQMKKLRRPEGSDAGRFGTAVSFSQGTAVIGAPTDLNLFNNQGHTFFYRIAYNTVPVMLHPIPDQLAELWLPFTYDIPADTFLDPDLNEVLSISVRFPDGSRGLSFADGILSGTPNANGPMRVQITARDLRGAGVSGTFTIHVLATPRMAWDLAQFGHFVTNPTLAATVWGGGANPDTDRMINDQEYAFGGNPNSNDMSSITLDQAGSAVQVVTYTRRGDDPALTFTFQVSTNLVNWTNGIGSVSNEVVTPLSNGLEFVELQIGVAPTAPVRFYRIHAAW